MNTAPGIEGKRQGPYRGVENEIKLHFEEPKRTTTTWRKTMIAKTKHRSLREIALEISSDWRDVNYAAKPYLQSMLQLNRITDKFYHDEARSIVAYFLSNARTWKGENASRIKAELKAMLK